MLFNSLPFIFLFLPISLFVYQIINRRGLLQFSVFWLLLSSLFFYAYWNVNFLPVLLGSILVNFLIGRRIFSEQGTQSRKNLLILGVVFNIGLLVYFKYSNFMLDNVNWLLRSSSTMTEAGLPIGFGLLIVGPLVYKFHQLQKNTWAWLLGLAFIVLAVGYYDQANGILSGVQWFLTTKVHASQIVLPIGISFFTFTQIAFLVDVYLGKASEYRLKNYALFVSYYPHLLAGPIIHHAEMMPQFTSTENKTIDFRNIYLGLGLFTMGLFKKVVIADTFAIWANGGYSNVAHLGFLQAWATVLSYTFQLYFDFSGYTDMAIGISLLLNIKLPINFNSPYKSLNIQEFWRRWHITLSRFLKNYLYIFIGGNRVSESKILRNFLIVFLIGGIWHGAGWTFIVWGILHGVAISVRHLWGRLNIAMPSVLAWLMTFLFINIAWVFFRAPSMQSALTMLQDCISWHNFSMINPLMIAALVAGFVLCVFVKNSNEMIASKVMAWKVTPILLGSAFLISIYILLIRNSSAFLYFQF